MFFASGYTFSSLKNRLNEFLGRSFSGLIGSPQRSFLDVSLTQLRPVKVTILGESNTPGPHLVGGFATVLNALYSSGGIKTSGDIAKAIAGGATACMIGSLFAGTEESPGKLLTIKGKKFKSYRGMGSVGAMQKGSFDRYSQEETKNAKKLVAEGVEGMVPYKGKVEDVTYQLVGGLKSSMGYTGHKTIKKMQGNCKFVFISKAGARESNVHDVIM